MAANVDVTPVCKLFGKEFFIPDYQRGYRWEKQEIIDLLTDLYTYAKAVFRQETTSKFYCLQPLVVKERAENNYEVIDGQQRLTTIYLLLNYLNEENPFKLTYETRKNCEDFFEQRKYLNIVSSNPDFYHISKGYSYIKEWFEETLSKQERKLAEVILNNLINSNEKTPAEMSGYLPDKSGIIDDDGNKKYIVTLKIDTITSLDYIKEAYPFLFAHEIAHAYEDFCKHPNIKIEDKTSDEVKFIPGYVYKALTAENDGLRHFAGILYFSFDSEVVAMKNEIFQELYARRHRMRDLTLANEQLKKTRVYKRMLTIEEYVNDLEKNIDDDTQIKLINLYNKTFCSHITNYDDLLIKVNTKYIRARNKIISAAGNAVYFGYAMRNKVWDY